MDPDALTVAELLASIPSEKADEPIFVTAGAGRIVGYWTARGILTDAVAPELAAAARLEVEIPDHPGASEIRAWAREVRDRILAGDAEWLRGEIGETITGGMVTVGSRYEGTAETYVAETHGAVVACTPRSTARPVVVGRARRRERRATRRRSSRAGPADDPSPSEQLARILPAREGPR